MHISKKIAMYSLFFLVGVSMGHIWDGDYAWFLPLFAAAYSGGVLLGESR